MKFLFKYATRGRPEWFMQTLDRYYAMLSGKNEYQFVITIDKDDESMNNDTMLECLDMQDYLRYFIGKHNSKIEAINADINPYWEWDILFVISDDMVPVEPGFDVLIAEAMQKHFPDMNGALHYPDGCCNTGPKSAITLTIMGKKLYEHFGYIYHPDYKSFYCDNEFADEVYAMKRCVYIPQIIVKHIWTGGTKGDNTYKLNTKKGAGDEATYNKRKQEGFPKDVYTKR